MTFGVGPGLKVLHTSRIVYDTGAADCERNKWVWTYGECARTGIKGDSVNFSVRRYRNLGNIRSLKDRAGPRSIGNDVGRPVTWVIPIARSWSGIPNSPTSLTTPYREAHKKENQW
jgi:hypothetical protein